MFTTHYLGNTHISDCLLHILYALACWCTEAGQHFFKQENVRRWSEVVRCEAEFAECSRCEQGNVLCEHDTSLAFEISRLPLRLNLNEEKSDAFSFTDLT